MWLERALLKLNEKKTYRRSDLLKIFKKEKKDLSESTFRWQLYDLLKKGKIYKKDYNTYSILKSDILPLYKPCYSDSTKTLSSYLENNYPDLLFVVFESVLLNEFLNHQIAQNTIYIQVEKYTGSFVFESIRNEFKGTVLYKPDQKEFERYWTRDCIVVCDLISQSPLSNDAPHEITVEKMLVDIIAEKSISVTFSPSEVPCIYANVMESYKVDRRKLNRYAGRRGKTEEVKQFTRGDKNAIKGDVHG